MQEVLNLASIGVKGVGAASIAIDKLGGTLVIINQLARRINYQMLQ
jgi:hypothetical protein